ncbi:hypothetical protein GOV11_00775 [Candidatus Woesearchaeota archaeon]|nr:hypothetical protein [Candidatus Woesearchaeota archaeon]
MRASSTATDRKQLILIDFITGLAFGYILGWASSYADGWIQTAGVAGTLLVIAWALWKIRRKMSWSQFSKRFR